MPLAPLLLSPLLALSIFDSDPERPTSSVDPNYFELLERNSHIVYPALALLVLGLVTVAILQASKAHDMDGAVKAEFKKLIIDELRRYPAGLETPDLAAATGLDRSKLVRLLDQMQQEGVLVSHTTTQRQTVWRVKGVGGHSY
jgi:IclR-like helix-turn-helix domain-containing protein